MFDNDMNKRFLFGNFPNSKLLPAKIEDMRKVDFDMYYKREMSALSKNPEVLSALFICCNKKVAELEILNESDSYKQSISSYINAGCSFDFLRINGSYNIADDLLPVVTPLDKTIWYAAFAYSMEKVINPIDEQDSTSKMLFWISLLLKAQDMEIHSHRSIDVNKVDLSTNIINLIENGFIDSQSDITRTLTDKEANSLKELSNRRKQLLSKIQEEQITAKKTAEETQEEWNLFLSIINDLSEKESSVICNIIDSKSAKDKLNYIANYNNILAKIEKGKYFLDDNEIDLLSVFHAVNKRLNESPSFACAQTEDGVPFKVSPALLMLAMEPRTNNYLFMTFHRLRMEPKKENAKCFISLALSSLKNNLGKDSREYVSLDDMIYDFYKTVQEFYKEHESDIKQLSFDKLQPDLVSVIKATNDTLPSLDLFNEFFIKKVEEEKQELDFEEEFEKLVFLPSKTIDIDTLKNRLDKESADLDTVQKQAFARQIVYSLNIIYMFCDALRIILSNQHIKRKIKNPDVIKRYRIELLNIDDKLVHTVYAYLDPREIGMLEYREKHGINSSMLSEQENQEEKYRNSLFSDILKDTINNLVLGIENQRSEQILQIKKEIRKEILQYPDCDNKNLFTSWLDSISERISNVLIDNSKKTEEIYFRTKNQIITSLGDSSEILPISTLDSLTSAELLYEQYATSEYAEMGFDFSCISALYYQAFEDAYNELIWRGYANLLNTLVLSNDQKYTEYLQEKNHKKIKDSYAIGYLDSDYSQRKYYIDHCNNQTSVSLRCMYKSFAILMRNIQNPTKLDGFCDYFAELTGFMKKEDMFNDIEFMHKCKEFTDSIDRSADNRNNASHGGSLIDINQCREDKKTVLNDLEQVRSNSIGLIQQLIYILQRE